MKYNRRLVQYVVIWGSCETGCKKKMNMMLIAEILQRMKGKSVVQEDSIKDADLIAENNNNRKGDGFRKVQPQFRDETRPRRLELPLFFSDNPYGWLNRAKHCFHFDGIDDKDKLEAVAVCLGR